MLPLTGHLLLHSLCLKVWNVSPKGNLKQNPEVVLRVVCLIWYITTVVEHFSSEYSAATWVLQLLLSSRTTWLSHCVSQVTGHTLCVLLTPCRCLSDALRSPLLLIRRSHCVRGNRSSAARLLPAAPRRAEGPVRLYFAPLLCDRRRSGDWRRSGVVVSRPRVSTERCLWFPFVPSSCRSVARCVIHCAPAFWARRVETREGRGGGAGPREVVPTPGGPGGQGPGGRSLTDCMAFH